MKTTFLLFISALVTSTVLGESDPLSSAVQKGLFEEEVNRNFKAAIEAYESAIAQFDENRQLAATAIFRLAENYRRAERPEEARALYERVVREFHDQDELVHLAMERLPSGSGSPAEPTLADEEVQEIENLKRIIRDSPDLLHTRNKNGNTRLHDAVEKRQVKVVEFLIAQGLDLTARNLYGLTPLHLSAQEGFKSGVELLLAKGADVMSTYRGGLTPLHLSAERGHLAITELLLDQSADANAASRYGETPLHKAAASEGPQAHEIARLLLDHGAEINAVQPNGRTPLYLLVERNRASIEFAEFLLDRGADPNLRGPDGDTPLHRAVQSGNIHLADLLIKRGADVNTQDVRGQTPLDYLSGDPADPHFRDMEELLRKNGATVGRFHAQISVPGQPEKYVVWDRSETMTLTTALREAGINPQELRLVRLTVPSPDPRRGRTFGQMVDIPPILSSESADRELENRSEIIIEARR